jgi:hypothetical protein
MDKKLKISIETIQILEQMTKVNNQLWIVSGQTQVVVSPDKVTILFVQLKEDIPKSWFPNWNKKHTGFGISDVRHLLKLTKDLNRPYWDFSKLKSKKQILICDEHSKSEKVVQTIAPDTIAKIDTSKFKIPEFDVKVKMSWNEIMIVKKLSKPIPSNEFIEVESDGKDGWFKMNEHTYAPSGYWSPKKPFLYRMQPDRWNVSKGDYTIQFSTHMNGWSKWVSEDGKYIYYIPLGTKDNWFDKKSNAVQKYKTTSIKVLTGKEHKVTSDFAEKVNASWRKSVDAIIETGELLTDAKKRFHRNEMMWSSFMNSLPFGIRTMEMLINVAKYKNLLLHPKIHKSLPASWGTLYELVNVGSPKPITIYESRTGEVSNQPKSGFDKRIIGKEDLLLRGIEDETIRGDTGNIPVIRPDMTRQDAINYRTRVENTYFPVVVKKSVKPQPETFLTIKVRAGKDISVDTLRDARDEVKSVLKGKPFTIVENKRVIKKRK